jgi:hypothetical protein
MAETAIPLDAMEYYDKPDIELNKDEQEEIKKYCSMRNDHRRIQGQTNDRLRSAGLKIVSNGLKRILNAGETRDRDRLRVGRPPSRPLFHH